MPRSFPVPLLRTGAGPTPNPAGRGARLELPAVEQLDGKIVELKPGNHDPNPAGSTPNPVHELQARLAGEIEAALQAKDAQLTCAHIRMATLYTKRILALQQAAEAAANASRD